MPQKMTEEELEEFLKQFKGTLGQPPQGGAGPPPVGALVPGGAPAQVSALSQVSPNPAPGLVGGAEFPVPPAVGQSPLVPSGVPTGVPTGVAKGGGATLGAAGITAGASLVGTGLQFFDTKKQRKKAEEEAKEAQKVDLASQTIGSLARLLEDKLITQQSHERRMESLRQFLAQIGARPNADAPPGPPAGSQGARGLGQEFRSGARGLLQSIGSRR